MAEQKKTDHKAIGLTFLIAGAGMGISLGMTVGWVFASAGAGLAVIGLIFLAKKDDEQ